MQNQKSEKKEKSLFEILHLVYRKKLIIVFSVSISLIIAYLYSQNVTPIYESKALLKKDIADRKQAPNDFYEIVKLQTQDEVDTELELVKTSEVLGEVVKDLKLNIRYNQIVTPDGKDIELKHVFAEFPDSGNYYRRSLGFHLPRITKIKINNPESSSKKLYIVKKAEYNYELRDALDDRLYSNSEPVYATEDSEPYDAESIITDEISLNPTLKRIKSVTFNLKSNKFDLIWPEAPIGSKLFFDYINYYSAINILSGQIGVAKVGKTNVFQLSVKSPSPFAAQTIANSVIDKYREVRMEQQKQTIKYSFKFVDEQLEEVKENLLIAENNLTNYKASGQIISINESSQELISYLSSLEAEKLKADLLLSDYRSKFEELKRELESSGYFDQSYLDLNAGGEANSPFSSLLKQVSDLELQRLELLQKRNESHPDIVNLDTQIKLTKEKLGGYNQNTLTSYQMQINSLEKKLIKIVSLMSVYEGRMQKLPATESQMARLMRQKDVYEKMFNLLLNKREEMRIAEVSKLQDIIIVDPPQNPLRPISPNKMLNMIIGLVLGSFFGLVIIFVVELKNIRLINIDDIEDDFQLPVLSILPKYPREIVKRIQNGTEFKDKFASLMDENLGIKESIRLLKTKMLLHLDNNDRIILITSCEENTGKTTLVANLAITFSLENKKVLIIDCDLKKGELSKMFNLPSDTPGLIQYLTTESRPMYTRVMKNIDIIPAGGLREDSAALLDSEKMKILLETLNISDYDYVFFDTAPVTRVVDTLILGRIIKNALVVVRPGVSVKETVSTGIQEMKQAKFKVRGIIANAVEIQKSYTYRYKYGYGYGYSSGNNGKSSGKILGKLVKLPNKSKSVS